MMKNWMISLGALFLGLGTPIHCDSSAKKEDHSGRKFFSKTEFFHFLSRCIAGDKEAQNLLFQWHTAQINSVHARPLVDHNLGLCYKNGWGCAKDPVKAITFFQRAIYKGDWMAFFSLSAMQYKGQGNLKPDPATAKMLFFQGLKKAPYLSFLFQGLSELKKSEKAFVLWLNQINSTQHLSPLPPALMEACFETFTSFLEPKENEFLYLIMEGGLRLSTSFPLHTLISFLKQSLVLIHEGKEPLKQSRQK